MNSLLHGKKTLAIPALRLPPGFGSPRASACAAPHGASASSPGVAEPHVEIVREGDKVVRLIVTCGCGERVEVECLYSVGT